MTTIYAVYSDGLVRNQAVKVIFTQKLSKVIDVDTNCQIAEFVTKSVNFKASDEKILVLKKNEILFSLVSADMLQLYRILRNQANALTVTINQQEFELIVLPELALLVSDDAQVYLHLSEETKVSQTTSGVLVVHPKVLLDIQCETAAQTTTCLNLLRIARYTKTVKELPPETQNIKHLLTKKRIIKMDFCDEVTEQDLADSKSQPQTFEYDKDRSQLLSTSTRQRSQLATANKDEAHSQLNDQSRTAKQNRENSVVGAGRSKPKDQSLMSQKDANKSQTAKIEHPNKSPDDNAKQSSCEPNKSHVSAKSTSVSQSATNIPDFNVNQLNRKESAENSISDISNISASSHRRAKQKQQANVFSSEQSKNVSKPEAVEIKEVKSSENLISLEQTMPEHKQIEKLSEIQPYRKPESSTEEHQAQKPPEIRANSSQLFAGAEVGAEAMRAPETPNNANFGDQAFIGQATLEMPQQELGQQATVEHNSCSGQQGDVQCAPEFRPQQLSTVPEDEAVADANDAKEPPPQEDCQQEQRTGELSPGLASAPTLQFVPQFAAQLAEEDIEKIMQTPTIENAEEVREDVFEQFDSAK